MGYVAGNVGECMSMYVKCMMYQHKSNADGCLRERERKTAASGGFLKQHWHTGPRCDSTTNELRKTTPAILPVCPTHLQEVQQ